jgi:hypothetical protein
MVKSPIGVVMVSWVVSEDDFARNGITSLTPAMEPMLPTTDSFM